MAEQETTEQRELREDREAFVALADLFEDALFETFTAADERLNHVRRANRQRSKDAWKTFAEALVDYGQGGRDEPDVE